MNKPFRYAAWLELLQAAAGHEIRTPNGGNSFVTEVERLYGPLCTQPAMGQRIDSEFRQFPLKRLRYSLVYRLVDGCVVVSAIVDSRRKAGYWRGNTAWVREPPLEYPLHEQDWREESPFGQEWDKAVVREIRSRRPDLARSMTIDAEAALDQIDALLNCK